MILRRIAMLLLAAALLVGWQSALEHPLEHVDEHGGFVHATGGHDPQEHEGCAAVPAVAAAPEFGAAPSAARLRTAL